ncbi:MAG: hypothetical protein NTX97_00425, partial [Bacteroidetes bacterium]|nr:hypothetical protein [Bacteroidota bacterium]
ISFFTRLNFEPGVTSEVLGIIFSAGTLIIFSLIGYKLSILKNKFIFPFITLALVFNYDYNVWATSGLEVSFATFLLSSAFYIYFFTELSYNKRLLYSGFFICIGLMVRPDIMLILLFLNFLLFIKNLFDKSGFIKLIKVHCLFNLWVVLIYLPYFLWRFNYYGFIFPNTYYAKLGYEIAFKQGLIYLWMYFKCHFTSFLILVPFLFICSAILKHGVKKFFLNKELAPLFTALSVVLVYLICFVAKVGGDFMYARFIILCVPFIYFVIVYSLVLIDFKHLNVVLLIVLSLSGVETLIRINMFIERDEKGNENAVFQNGIADERYYYLYFSNTDKDVANGKELKERLKDIKYKGLIVGTQARFAYYAGFSYCQDYFGLTDTLIAHTVIKERGRVGHEKSASPEYIESKKINFIFFTDSFDGRLMKNDFYRTAEINLKTGPIKMEIFTYDSVLMGKLEKRLGNDFRYTNFPNYLDSYIIDSLPKISSSDKLDLDYNKFYAYYFKNNIDPRRENVFIQKRKELMIQDFVH